jgi:hypothetical protein
LLSLLQRIQWFSTIAKEKDPLPLQAKCLAASHPLAAELISLRW